MSLYNQYNKAFINKGITLERAVEKYGIDVGLTDVNEETLIEMYNMGEHILDNIINDLLLLSTNNCEQIQFIDEAIIYSINKLSLYKVKETLTTYVSKQILNENIDTEYKLKETLCKLGNKCFNPLTILNGVFPYGRSIIKVNHLKYKDFVEPVYRKCKAKRIHSLNIKEDMPNTIIISPDDIISIDYRLYHPLIRMYILQGNIDKLYFSDIVKDFIINRV